MFECRNCAGSRSRPRYRGLPDRLHGIAGAFDYVACETCGLIQIAEIPPNLGDYYTGYRVHGSDSALYRALRKLTIGHCYYQAPGRGRALLDIGCGNGTYLREMAARGWRAVGYELDPVHAAALSRDLGLPVIAGPAALADHAGEFDLLTFNFSFEHLDRPRELLAQASACLKPGGTIYLSVPNIESREAAFFGERWFHLDPPRHVSFFTKDLLRRALDAAGFTAIETRDLPVPTGFAGSVSYRLWGRFQPLAWYAGIVPGLAWSAVVGDGNFAISGRRIHL